MRNGAWVSCNPLRKLSQKHCDGLLVVSLKALENDLRQKNSTYAANSSVGKAPRRTLTICDQTDPVVHFSDAQ